MFVEVVGFKSGSNATCSLLIEGIIPVVAEALAITCPPGEM